VPSASSGLRRRQWFAGHDETPLEHTYTDASVRREPGAPQPVSAQPDVRHVPIAGLVAAVEFGIVRGTDGDAPLGG